MICGLCTFNYARMYSRESDSKHIVPGGGFAQPTLSLVLRREDLRNPSQHVGLTTSDRVLVG
jgi:hypothetical protein